MEVLVAVDTGPHLALGGPLGTDTPLGVRVVAVDPAEGASDGQRGAAPVDAVAVGAAPSAVFDAADVDDGAAVGSDEVAVGEHPVLPPSGDEEPLDQQQGGGGGVVDEEVPDAGSLGQLGDHRLPGQRRHRRPPGQGLVGPHREHGEAEDVGGGAEVDLGSRERLGCLGC